MERLAQKKNDEKARIYGAQNTPNAFVESAVTY